MLLTENDTNNERIFGKSNPTAYVKDAINNYVVTGRLDAVNPSRNGTKIAAYYQVNVAAGGTAVIRLRLRQSLSLRNKRLALPLLLLAESGS